MKLILFYCQHRTSSEIRRKQPKMNVQSPALNTTWSNMNSNLFSNTPIQQHRFPNISGKKLCPKITQYIKDKPARLKSYFRRRHVPFKRTYDMNLQCGTKSLLIQISDDIEECLYHGDDNLVDQFLDTGQGVNISLVHQMIQQEKGHRRLSRSSLDEYGFSGNDSKSANRNKVKSQQTTDFEKNDEDFFATAKEKEQKEKERRKEAQQRILEGDYLSNIADRNKAFKSRKDALIGKMAETDEVCATKSFLVVLNHDNDAIFYYGHPTLVTKFFTTGLTRNCISTNYNIRMFESEEFDQNSINTCSVPQCVVTRNSLSKWRVAAMALFDFPSYLPMTLYTCSETEKDKWIAELDLNPETTGRIAVCSLHFKNGEPTDDSPLPTELLSDKDDKPLKFRGICKSGILEGKDKTDVLDNSDEPQKQLKMSDNSKSLPHFTQLIFKNSRHSYNKRKKILKAINFRRRKKLVVAEAIAGDEQSIRKRRRNLAIFTNFGSKLLCRFCAKFCKNTMEYLEHIKLEHIDLTCSKNSNDASTNVRKVKESLKNEIQPEIIDSINKDDIEKTSEISNIPQKPQDSSSLVSSMQNLLKSIKIEERELESLLRDLYPFSIVKTMNPRKKYVCAVCKSVCDLFGLFTHMKTVHQGLLCQYCLKLFKKVADLEIHLSKVHFVYRRYYNNKASFKEYSGDSYTFACTQCSSFVPFESLESHKCENQVQQYDCPYCDRPFGQKEKLELHMANGWCKAMPWMLKIEYDNDNHQSSMLLRSKRLAVLTGRKNNENIDEDTLRAFESESKIYEPAIWDVNSSQTTKSEQQSLQMIQEKNPSPKKSALNFNPWDRNFLNKFSNPTNNNLNNFTKTSSGTEDIVIIEDIPNTGSIFCGTKGKGINQLLKEETETGQKFDIKQKFIDAKASCSEANKNLNASIARMQIFKSKNNFFIQNNRELIIRQSSINAAKAAKAVAASLSERKYEISSKLTRGMHDASSISTLPQDDLREDIPYQTTPFISTEDKENISNQENFSSTGAYNNQENLIPETALKSQFQVKRENKAERMLRMSAEIEMGFANLRKALDYYASNDLRSSNENTGKSVDTSENNACSLCQQARNITVDAIFIYNHLATHNLQETNNILKEDPVDAISRLKKYFRDSRLQEMLFQYSILSDDSDGSEDQIHVYHSKSNNKQFLNSGTYSCCSCSNSSSVTYNQLLEHLNTVHGSKVLTCQLCQNIFLNYGSFSSHVCYGPLTDVGSQPRAKFSCKICDRHDLQSFLEFQYHIRKEHNTCEICFYRCLSQEDLYEHCIKHTNELMCMKCFRAYDDQHQLRKHLYFNHQAEHKICSQCHHKSWPHVYHFCLLNSSHENTCEVCDKSFDDFQKYRVHFRIHTGVKPHKCQFQGCEKSYISKQLLNKHRIRRHPELKEKAEQVLLCKKEQKEMIKYGASQRDTVGIIRTIIGEIVGDVVVEPSNCEEPLPSEVSPSKEHTVPEMNAAEVLANLGDATMNDCSVMESDNQYFDVEAAEYDPVAAAVSSIMDIDSMFSIKKSPVKGHAISPHRDNRLSMVNSTDQKMSRIHQGMGNVSQNIVKFEHQEPVIHKPKILGHFNRNSSSTREIANPSHLLNTKEEISQPVTILRPTTNDTVVDASIEAERNPLIAANSSQNNLDRSEQSADCIDKVNSDISLLSSIKNDKIVSQDTESTNKPKVNEVNSSAVATPIPSSTWNQDMEQVPKEDISVHPEISDAQISQLENSSNLTTIDHLDSTTINKKLVTGQGWDVDLSESSEESETEGVAPKKVSYFYYSLKTLSFQFFLSIIALIDTYNL